MSGEYYQSAHTGLTIDHAISRIVNGELDKLAAGATNAAAAAQSALAGVEEALDNLPEGDTLIINDLTTGGESAALSAEMGKVLGQRPNPNLLLNWYFKNPVNRNGKTEYVGYNGLIDCWRGGYNSDTMTLTEDGMTFANNRESGSTFLRQYFPAPLPAGTYTLSFLVAAVSGTVIGYFSDDGGSSLGNVTLKAGLVSVTRTLADGVCGRVQFTIANGGSMTLIAAKLERGSVQTLAHQDSTGAWVLNEIPNYAEQYALCCQFSQYNPYLFVGSQHSNPNLLDNWYLADPINQRGATEYAPGSRRYTIDRWEATDDVRVMVSEGSVTATNEGTTNNSLVQPINPDIALNEGDLVTLSFLTASGEFYSCLYEFPEYGNYYNGFTLSDDIRVRLYSASDSGHHNRVVFYLTPGASIELVAVKLELGPVQTLAHQDSTGAWVLNDPPPNKALELAKCQRYQIVYNLVNTGRYFAGVASGDTYVFMQVPVPANHRLVIPTITLDLSQLTLRRMGVNYEITDFRYYCSATNIMTLRLTSSGLTAGESYLLYATGATKIIVDYNL